jgi:CRP-like cAMP-binding protein
VLLGARRNFRGEYGCLASDGRCTFTLTIAHFAANGVAHALVTREHVGKHKEAVAFGASKRASVHRVAAMARAGTSNRLLAALPEDEYQRLLARLEPVQLTYGQVLYEPGKQIRYVYFPNNCPVSLLTVVEGDRSLEVGLVGCEGVVGFPAALGSSTSSVRALVQGTGTGLRMEAVEFLKEYQRSPSLQQALLCFSEGLMNQVTQNAACNHFHAIQQRLARWLLMMRERVPSRNFYLTHDYLADMLGTRPETVTQGAYALGSRNLIKYSRGNITILDRRGLEAVSCFCYRRVRIVGPKASA